MYSDMYMKWHPVRQIASHSCKIAITLSINISGSRTGLHLTQHLIVSHHYSGNSWVSLHLRSTATGLSVQKLVQAYKGHSIKSVCYWLYCENPSKTGGFPSPSPVLQNSFFIKQLLQCWFAPLIHDLNINMQSKQYRNAHHRLTVSHKHLILIMWIPTHIKNIFMLKWGQSVQS